MLYYGAEPCILTWSLNGRLDGRLDGLLLHFDAPVHQFLHCLLMLECVRHEESLHAGLLLPAIVDKQTMYSKMKYYDN